jgi:hypothetical protein
MTDRNEPIKHFTLAEAEAHGIPLDCVYFAVRPPRPTPVGGYELTTKDEDDGKGA